MVGGDKPVKCVMFVPFTPKGELRRRLPEKESLLIGYGSIKNIENQEGQSRVYWLSQTLGQGTLAETTAFYATQGTQEYAWTKGHCTRQTGCYARWRGRRPTTLARQPGPCGTGGGAPGQAEKEVSRECPPLPPGAGTSSEGLRVCN